MQRNGSLTAQAVALFRAASGDDPIAPSFLGPVGRAGLALWRRVPGFGPALDRLSMGLVTGVLARHAFFDAMAREGLADGSTQLVLLGAGFDARPWRLAEDLAGRPVFQVDHPATAARRAALAPGEPPGDVRRVDIDFACDDLAEALRGAGFAAGEPAVVIWEGVSMYLTEQAVRATLGTLGGLLAPGSSVLFDVWYAPRRSAARAAQRVGRAAIGGLGEPLRWVPAPDRVSEVLAAAGLRASRVQRGRDVPGFPNAHEGLRLVVAHPIADAA